MQSATTMADTSSWMILTHNNPLHETYIVVNLPLQVTLSLTWTTQNPAVTLPKWSFTTVNVSVSYLRD